MNLIGLLTAVKGKRTDTVLSFFIIHNARFRLKPIECRRTWSWFRIWHSSLTTPTRLSCWNRNSILHQAKWITPSKDEMVTRLLGTSWYIHKFPFIPAYSGQPNHTIDTRQHLPVPGEVLWLGWKFVFLEGGHMLQFLLISIHYIHHNYFVICMICICNSI